MILLTGATGLLGSFILQKLLLENEKVRITLREHSDISINLKLASVEKVNANLLDISTLDAAMEGVETIIHCAAMVSFSNNDNNEMYAVNVEGTKNIVNLSLKKKIRLIHISSIAAIGRESKSNIINENSQWVDSDLNSFYAKTKYLAELEVWRGIEEGLNAVILNPSVILGPSDWNKSSTKIFKNIYDGMHVYPIGTTNIVDVRDVADATYILYKSNAKAERYIINASNIPYKDFFSEISLSLNRTPPKFKLSKNVSLFIYYLLNPFLGLYFKRKFISRETITITSSDFKYENFKFKHQFGFEYKDSKETISWVCKELINNHKNEKRHNV